MFAATLLLTAAGVSAKETASCDVFSENQCTGSTNITPESFEDHRWYTPDRSSKDWKPSFQDYAVLAAHSHVEYDAKRTGATVTVLADHRDGAKLTYSFDGEVQNSNSMTFSTANKNPVSVSVMGADGSVIELEPLDFMWNNDPISVSAANAKGDYRDGQKGAIVEMFMWPHVDVGQECEMLGKMGYMGVKLFPAQEQVFSYETFNNDLNPWYFAYQPVSYRLQGRMGSRNALRDAIATCRSHGVRVYADAVINHMVGGANDANPYHRNPGANCAEWGAKNSSLGLHYAEMNSTAFDGPSPMYTQSYSYTYGDYTGKPPSQEFPAAHLGPTDFHCEQPVNSWTDCDNLNSGWLSGLVDLNTEKESVQARIADYLTDLLGIGFSGFRIDAAKHINPDDLVGILTKLKTNLGGDMPADFMTYMEVLLGGEADMLSCNVDSGCNYGGYLEDALYAAGWKKADVDKVKLWNSGYPKEPQAGFCSTSPQRNAVQNDDADQQTDGSSSRDMGDQGCVLVEGCAEDTHRQFEVKLFADPNGAEDNDNDYPIRLVLSSYYWEENSSGVPDGYSDCSKCTSECESCRTTTAVTAYDAKSCGYDKSYTRAHRDLDVVNAMREWMHLDAVTAKDLGLTC